MLRETRSRYCDTKRGDIGEISHVTQKRLKFCLVVASEWYIGEISFEWRRLGSGVDRGLKSFRPALKTDFVIRASWEMWIGTCAVRCIV